MRELEFMNSSCLKAFVSWIAKLEDVEDPQAQYRIRFLSDATKLWQRRSLGALTCIDADRLQVDSA
jgi:hypothetical protein